MRACNRFTHSVSTCTVCTSGRAAMADLSVSRPSGVLAATAGVTTKVSGSGLSSSASKALPKPEAARNCVSASSAVITRTAATSARACSCLASTCVWDGAAFLSR